MWHVFFLSLKYITKYIISVKWFYFLRTGNNAVENRSGLMRGERDAVVGVMTDTQLRRLHTLTTWWYPPVPPMASNIRQILYAGLTHFIDRHTVFPIKYTQAFTVFCIHCILSYSFLDSCYFLRGGSEVSTGFVYHGGTTEEGNCSYLRPRAAAAGSNGTNKGQIHKVPVDEIARFFRCIEWMWLDLS